MPERKPRALQLLGASEPVTTIATSVAAEAGIPVEIVRRQMPRALQMLGASEPVTMVVASAAEQAGIPAEIVRRQMPERMPRALQMLGAPEPVTMVATSVAEQAGIPAEIVRRNAAINLLPASERTKRITSGMLGDIPRKSRSTPETSTPVLPPPPPPPKTSDFAIFGTRGLMVREISKIPSLPEITFTEPVPTKPKRENINNALLIAAGFVGKIKSVEPIKKITIVAGIYYPTDSNVTVTGPVLPLAVPGGLVFSPGLYKVSGTDIEVKELTDIVVSSETMRYSPNIQLTRGVTSVFTITSTETVLTPAKVDSSGLVDTGRFVPGFTLTYLLNGTTKTVHII